MLSGRVARRLVKRRPCHNASAADQQDPAVSEGACAQALRAHPHELLSVAVARLIFFSFWGSLLSFLSSSLFGGLLLPPAGSRRRRWGVVKGVAAAMGGSRR